MSKLNKILLALLIVQIIITGFAFWPRTTAQSGGGPLLPGFSAGNVVKLTITDNEHNSVTLAKKGDEWVIPAAADFPAITTTVTTLLDKIEKIKTNRLVTQTEASHKRLQVGADSYARLIELQLADGSSQKLYVGSSAGAGATHVRLNDQPQVYLSGDLSNFDANAQTANWIDAKYVDVAADKITAFTLKNKNGTFEFTKDNGIWKMANLASGETFGEDGLNTLLNQVTTLRMTAPLSKTDDATYGLANPAATVTIKTADKSYTLAVGAQKDKDYVAKWSESPYYALISEANAKLLLDKTHPDFLKKPETAPAAPGASVIPGAPVQPQ